MGRFQLHQQKGAKNAKKEESGVIIGVLVRPNVMGAVGVGIVVLRRYSTVSIQI